MNALLRLPPHPRLSSLIHHGPPSLPWQYVPSVPAPPRSLLTIPSELPPDARAEDVSKFFDGYGRIVDCRVMTGSLLPSSTRQLCLPAIHQASASSNSRVLGTLRTLFNTSTARASWAPSTPLSPGTDRLLADFLFSIVVEFAKETRPRRDPYDAERASRARRPPGYRLIVSGISRDTSWQVSTWSFVFILLDTARKTYVDPLAATTSISWDPGALTNTLQPGPEGLRARSWQCLLRGHRARCSW